MDLKHIFLTIWKVCKSIENVVKVILESEFCSFLQMTCDKVLDVMCSIIPCTQDVVKVQEEIPKVKPRFRKGKEHSYLE